MRVFEVEQWALRVVEAIRATGRVEDILVEVKAIAPDGNAAARRLAGHANAVRGENILWVVGIEEKTGKFFPVTVETSSWYRQVRSHFESECPSLEIDRHVDCEGGRVWALYFNTSRWPFVVRNDRYNRENGGAVQWEVPIRVGTEVQSARRIDLVRLLDNVARTPTFERLGADVEARPESEGRVRVGVRVLVFCASQDERPVSIPFYKCSGRLVVGDEEFDLIRMKVSPRLEAVLDGKGARRDRSFDPNVDYTGHDVRVVRTAPLLLSGLAIIPPDRARGVREAATVRAEFELGFVHGIGSIRIQADCQAKAGKSNASVWRWGDGDEESLWESP